MPRTYLHDGYVGFWCPGCDEMKAVDAKRWNFNGDLEKPTLSPSILQTVGPFPDGHKLVCHSIITGGRISYCGDCTHSMAGKEMELPDLSTVVENLGVVEGGSMGWRRKS